MIERRELYICDWCSSTSGVESFYFSLSEAGEVGENCIQHRHIELCRTCQAEAYAMLTNVAMERASHD